MKRAEVEGHTYINVYQVYRCVLNKAENALNRGIHRQLTWYKLRRFTYNLILLPILRARYRN